MIELDTNPKLFVFVRKRLPTEEDMLGLEAGLSSSSSLSSSSPSL
jgi:hypothetical protein